MKKIFNKSTRVLCVILAALMLVSVFSSAQVFALDTAKLSAGEKSGKIEGTDWKFDESTGALTISGNGPSADINGIDAWSGMTVKKVVVESGVTTVGDRIFSNLYALEEAVIADTVTDIKFCAFMNCFNLKTVKLPASLKTIEEDAFSYCDLLENVVIPDGCEEIKSNAFYGGRGLSTITIPASVKTVGESAFENTGLTGVTVAGKTTELKNYSFGYEYDGSIHKPIKGFKITCDEGSSAKTYYDDLLSQIPPETNVTWTFDSNSGTLTLSGTGETPWATDAFPAPWAQHYEDIKHLIVNSGITIVNGIGPCENLRSVRLADSVQKIAAHAFKGEGDEDYRSSLNEVDFGKGLKEIGEGAFSDTSIREIKLPDSLETIGKGAFSGSAVSKVSFGSGLKKISDYAFYETNLLSVTIPENVTWIGLKALGYYYDERSSADGEYTIYNDFVENGFEIFAPEGSEGERYAENNGIVLVRGAASINKTKASLKAGKSTKLKLENSGVQYWYSSDDKVAYVDRNGKVYGLKKGKAYIYPVTPRGLKFKCKVNVTSNPSIKINGAKFHKNWFYYVKKGKKLKVTLLGRASALYNQYKSADKKIARVVSDYDTKTVKIKGYKKGKTTVAITFNGVKFKIKVKVY